MYYQMFNVYISLFVGICTSFGDSMLCEVIKGDNRTRPYPMNGVPVRVMILFPSITTTISGNIVNMSFYAQRSGPAFVSFWKPTEHQHEYEMQAKIPVHTRYSGFEGYYIVTQDIWVPSGSALAVHYTQSGDIYGVFDYERTDKPNPSRQLETHEVYSQDYYDDGWIPGSTVQFGGLQEYQQAVAVHVEICVLNECEDETYPCGHGATCINHGGGFSCVCTPGWTDDSCYTDINECEEQTSSCSPGATCINHDGGFSCVCAPGWTAYSCDTDIDECLNTELCNNGTCINEEGVYSCRCSDGATGMHCDIDINECSEDLVDELCMHGRCVNAVFGYKCACYEGYSGDVCNEEDGGNSQAPRGDHTGYKVAVGMLSGFLLISAVTTIAIVIYVQRLRKSGFPTTQAGVDAPNINIDILPLEAAGSDKTGDAPPSTVYHASEMNTGAQQGNPPSMYETLHVYQN